ncbi:iron-siderophore ABC transporter substrate-binding protein [Rhizobium sp. GR12]|uniref:iron-siderophore ABC transporter substrate-binding protein n=1 Tax=Rhizobium sp. GR12 TaxID=3053925 RepID=UPI002FBE72EF
MVNLTATSLPRGFSRRQAFGLVAGFAFAFPRLGKATTEKRVAAIDWAMLETLMAVGQNPVAATELIRFREIAVEPSVPETVVDLGLRGSPNFELLHVLKPELILSSPFYARHKTLLEEIAPVLSLPFYVKGEPPYAKALSAVLQLGAVVNRPDEAAWTLSEQEHILAKLRVELQRFSDRPTYLINIGDARHFRVFGADSLFGDILNRVGLENAWSNRSRFTFAAPVPLEQLADRPEARIVIVSDIPVEARSGLRGSMIWNSLEPVRAGRVVNIANVNPYGGIVAALRFARLLRDGLIQNVQ